MNDAMNKFRDFIRSKRAEKEMLLCHLSAKLDIDTAQLSKRERGEKTATGERINQLAKIFDLNINKLSALWLAGQVYPLAADEGQAIEALKIAEMN